MITGPIEEARRHMDRVMEQEPFFWLMHNLDAWIYYFEKKYPDAIEACDQASELKPDWMITEWLYFLNYAQLNQGQEAMEHLEKIIQADPRARKHAEEISTHYNSKGIAGLFDFLIHLNDTDPGYFHGINGDSFYNGWWYAILGQEEQALEYLRKALEQVDSSYTYFMLIAMNPDFDFIRSDPRFQKIIEALGLTPYNTRTAS
jgi:tetratricopeptide (TPR) repeat protein